MPFPVHYHDFCRLQVFQTFAFQGDRNSRTGIYQSCIRLKLEAGGSRAGIRVLDLLEGSCAERARFSLSSVRLRPLTSKHQRTWMYIGFACRLALELGLNKSHRPQHQLESDLHRRERRNRERTYLVLYVHDRSLSMHTGRPGMLPSTEELVRSARTWHVEGGMPPSPEDVIVSAFVEMRTIAVSTLVVDHTC